MTKEIRPLQRYNENTGQTETFYPGTTTDAIAHPTKRKSLTNVISDIEEAYAKQTGYYETLGAGTATNLRGVNPTEGTFTFRPSGGNADVANGTAYLERIKGNTVKWNQLIQNGDFSNGTENWLFDHITGAVNNGVLELTTRNIVWGHPTSQINYGSTNHYFALILDLWGDNTLAIQLYIDGTKGAWGYYAARSYVSSQRKRVVLFFQKENLRLNYMEFLVRKADGSAPDAGLKVYMDNVQLFDLTLMYGEGNEPSTIAQFEADYYKWFGKPLTYEAYTGGELRDVKMSAIKTIGFNQWDEEWENGYINQQTGEPSTGTGKRAKNFISVLPSTTYYFKTVNTGARIFEYDANKSFLTANQTVINSSFVTGNTTRFIKFQDSTPSYNNDLCINISNAKRNGEYEPHWAETKNVPITTLTGKLNGEGESVIVFPDGMRSAGSVHDEIYIENGKAYAIKRVGSVDLGTLTWSKNTLNDNTYFRTAVGVIDDAKAPSVNNIVFQNSCCGIFGNMTFGSLGGATPQECIGCSPGKGVGVNSNKRASMSEANFKTAMNGVMFYYELETPLIYELDNFQLPLPYRVDDYGTEEVTGAEKSVAPTLNIRYGINAGDTITNLPKNYISAESIDQLLATMSAAMGGTWTKTWDAANGRYTFSFTQTATLNLAPTEPEPEEES